MKVLLFDNYDSFTYNLLHILKELGAEVEVHRNECVRKRLYDKCLFSKRIGQGSNDLLPPK